MSHIPVLLQEVIAAFQPGPGKKFIDATANGGGHTQALRDMGADVLPIEWDPELASKIGAVNDSYVNIVEIARTHGYLDCDGVLFDLGFSSHQMDASGRGFSFQGDEVLDMRYHPTGPTAADIVNTYSLQDLERILREYGEERFDGRIAEALIKARPIATTQELVAAIRNAVPFSYRRGRIHFATRTFQALRIETNHELENVKQGLEEAMNVVREGGKVAVITFHSLEDRIVKNYFKNFNKNKPVRATWDEIKLNRRARSAKLRVAERTTPTP